MEKLERAVTKANLALLALEKLTEGFTDGTALVLVDQKALKEALFTVVEEVSGEVNEATKVRRTKRVGTTKGDTESASPEPITEATPQPTRGTKATSKPSKEEIVETNSGETEDSDFEDDDEEDGELPQKGKPVQLDIEKEAKKAAKTNGKPTTSRLFA